MHPVWILILNSAGLAAFVTAYLRAFRLLEAAEDRLTWEQEYE